MSPPQNITVTPGRMAILSPGEGAAVLTWHNPTEILDPDALDCDESTLRMCVVPRKPGRYAIGATVRADLTQWWVIDAGEAVKPAPRSFAWIGAGVRAVGRAVKAVVASPRLQGAVLAVALAVGGVTVKGCLPGPGPNPVDPTPVVPVDPPKPAPIPALGLRVLVVYEATKGAPQLTQKQQDELYGESLNTYLAAKCAKGADGKTPEFRIWDKDISLANAPELWRQAMGRTRASVPWIIISDGKTGHEGPLPDGGILDLIKKHGGS